MISVDWGTTSFRAWRLDADGRVLDARSASDGLLAAQGRFADVLARHLAGWPDATVLMAGMVGSRSGWREVPYVAAPAGLAEVAAGILRLGDDALPAALAGRWVGIVPGMSLVPDADSAVAPEVMRGEETQLLGLTPEVSDLAIASFTACLPGTHSKWVTIERGRIAGWRTAMTGEVYALLRRHSLLAALMPSPELVDADDADAFAQGVAASGAEGGLLHQLFGVRTRGLLAGLAPAAAPSFLSGLLIGHELRALAPPDLAAPVRLVGAAALTGRYRRALAQLGLPAHEAGEGSGALGLHRLARARGLATG